MESGSEGDTHARSSSASRPSSWTKSARGSTTTRSSCSRRGSPSWSRSRSAPLSPRSFPPPPPCSAPAWVHCGRWGGDFHLTSNKHMVRCYGESTATRLCPVWQRVACLVLKKWSYMILNKRGSCVWRSHYHILRIKKQRSVFPLCEVETVHWIGLEGRFSTCVKVA